MQWQHGLETATWCGGSGLPAKSRNLEESLLQLGTRLLTAHSDGSLGVWSLKDVGFTATTSTPTQPPLLTMEEAPTMPYGMSHILLVLKYLLFFLLNLYFVILKCTILCFFKICFGFFRLEHILKLVKDDLNILFKYITDLKLFFKSSLSSNFSWEQPLMYVKIRGNCCSLIFLESIIVLFW